MARPLRIEYADGYYHVMNRGRGRQRIFHDADYFEAFLVTLQEAHERFCVQFPSRMNILTSFLNQCCDFSGDGMNDVNFS